MAGQASTSPVRSNGGPESPVFGLPAFGGSPGGASDNASADANAVDLVEVRDESPLPVERSISRSRRHRLSETHDPQLESDTTGSPPLSPEVYPPPPSASPARSAAPVGSPAGRSSAEVEHVESPLLAADSPKGTRGGSAASTAGGYVVADGSPSPARDRAGAPGDAPLVKLTSAERPTPSPRGMEVKKGWTDVMVPSEGESEESSLGRATPPSSPDPVGTTSRGSFASYTRPATASNPSLSPHRRSRADVDPVIDARYADCLHKMKPIIVGPACHCKLCSKLIWGEGMKCMLCGDVIHVKCLPLCKASREGKGYAESIRVESFSAERGISTHSAHSFGNNLLQTDTCDNHVVQSVSLLAPATCTACKKKVWGAAFRCNNCDVVYHKNVDTCAKGLTTFDAHELKAESKEIHAFEFTQGRGEAVGQLKKLLLEFSARWPLRKKLALTNPVSLYKVGGRHKAMYEHMVTELPLVKDKEMVGDLTYACMFARAVYGVAISDGHLRSVGAAMRMHTVLKPFKNVGDDMTAKENDLGTMRELRTEADVEILMSDWANQVFRPVFVLFIDYTNQWVVLSVRGTVSQRDTLTDLAAEATPFLNGQGHSGVVKCAMSVLNNRALIDKLSEVYKDYPKYRYVATGHSLGAAVATVFTVKSVKMAREGACEAGEGWREKLECFAFGPPPTVNDVILREVNGHPRSYRILSVMCGYDSVPRVGLTNLERLAREIAGFPYSELHAESPHVRMHIPGRVLLIDHPVGRSTGKKKDLTRLYQLAMALTEKDIVDVIEGTTPPAADARVTPAEASYWVAQQMLVSGHSMADHLPDRYYDSLRKWSVLTPEQVEQLPRGGGPGPAKRLESRVASSTHSGGPPSAVRSASLTAVSVSSGNSALGESGKDLDERAAGAPAARHAPPAVSSGRPPRSPRSAAAATGAGAGNDTAAPIAKKKSSRFALFKF